MIHPPRNDADSFAQRLRDACRPLHDQLDALPALASLATRAPREEDYRRLLGAMAGVVPALEHALAAALPHYGLALWLPALNRARPLDEDCRTLGVHAMTMLPAPRLDSRESCLAALYVLEGARLGGRFMARNLCIDGSGSALPTKFLAMAPPPPLGWQRLLELLGACAGDGANAARACALARDVFEHLLHCLRATPSTAMAPA